jgi:hypothetical protein
MAIAVTAATMALAAPALPTNPTGIQGITTDNATCVTGFPAVPRDNNGSFPIIYYGNAKPIDLPENYILNKTGPSKHFLGRRQVILLQKSSPRAVLTTRVERAQGRLV